MLYSHLHIAVMTIFYKCDDLEPFRSTIHSSLDANNLHIHDTGWKKHLTPGGTIFSPTPEIF